MTKSSSANLVDQVTAAGIRYLPADQIYYKEFSYKVELSPLYKGLGTQKTIRFEVDIAFPDRGRQKLAEHVERAEKIFLNVEQRHEVIAFLESLEGVNMYRRMGGENNLIYLEDPDAVMILIDRYGSTVNSVTGPINDEHRAVFDEERKVVMRDKLFYDQFRYQIKFRSSQEFVENCQQLLIQTLAEKDQTTWRAHRLFNEFDNNSYFTSGRTWWPGQPTTRIWHTPNYRPQNVILYLEHDEDFIHIKLMTSEYIESFQEIMLFDELN